MVYAIINKEGQIKKIWNKINHFTSSNWARGNYRTKEHTIVAMEPKILAQFHINEEGIEGLRNFNASLPKNKNKKVKLKNKWTPDNIVSGVI